MTAPFSFSRNFVALDGSSANSSTRTSNAFLVGDAGQISVSWTTQNAVASKLTLQGSNDANPSSITNTIGWSNVSVIASAGVYPLQAGVRAIRFLRPSADSQSIVIVNYRG